jgi:hypothetical protein
VAHRDSRRRTAQVVAVVGFNLYSSTDCGKSISLLPVLVKEKLYAWFVNQPNAKKKKETERKSKGGGGERNN